MMINEDEVVLGQYEGYRDDPTVPDESNTPTFASVILRIHNERWEGVPFILKAGKALNSRKIEIRVDNIFKDVPHEIFQKFLVPSDASEKWVSYLPTAFRNYLHEAYVQVEDVHVSKRTEIVLLAGKEEVTIQDATENLILDTIRGDQQQFVRRDELEASWKIFISLLHRIDRGEFKPLPYEAYGRGPKEAVELLQKASYVETPIIVKRLRY
ncbi:glucose-6-phosphate 1-dehydrogenase, cytoplasmic isoform-like [Arachis duranensis]|uniref:glucose-6-phosphate dehydrogenase (NADP(+)) n=1 Tax=Arachis duranensis TaxID=130453 RepID=A0A9C6TNL5_ARADU|nr:glucose-6-phosphate 1-dehydrogenase, cytoplasmic isoform-like [Arachis duranensis]